MTEFKGFVHDDDLDDFAQELTELGTVQLVRGNSDQIESHIKLKKPAQGLPSSIREMMVAYDVVIIDFVRVSNRGITVYFGPRDNKVKLVSDNE